MAKVTYVHFGANESEIGIHFSADDGAGGTVEGRAFAEVDPAMKETVLKAAQAALDALTDTLPADYHPGAVTSALMKARNARQEQQAAEAARHEAEIAKAKAEAEKAAAEDLHARIQQQTAAKQKELDALQAEHERQAADKRSALDALDAEIAAKRAEAETAAANATVQDTARS